MEEISSVINKHAPLRSRCVNNRPSAPWMNDEVKAAKRQSRIAERKYRKSKVLSDKELFRQC